MSNRFWNYIQLFVVSFLYLILIIPFIVSNIVANDPNNIRFVFEQQLTNTRLLTAFGLSILFLILSCVLLFAQQYFWFKSIKKFAKYEVDKKILVKYRNSGIGIAVLILFTFVVTIIIFLSEISIPNADINKRWEIKKILFIVFSAIIPIIGISLFANSTYIDFKYIWDQTKQESLSNKKNDDIQNLIIEQDSNNPKNDDI